MRILAKLVALFFAILFILTAVPTLTLSNLSFHLTHPQTYKAALKSQKIYEKFPKLAAEQIYLQTHYTGPKLEEGGEEESSEESTGGPPAFLLAFSQEDWEIILAELLPPQILKPLIEDMLDGAFANFFSPGQEAPATISLKAFKAHLAQGAAKNAALKVIRAQGPCTQDQIRELQKDVSQLIACAPPEEVLTSLTPQMDTYLQSNVLATIPDEVNLGQIGQSEPTEEEAPPSEEGGGPSPELVRTFRTGMILSPLLPFLLLLLVALFGARSKRSLSLWWGIPLSIVGVLGIGLATSLLPALDKVLAEFATPKIPPYISANLATEGLGVVREVVRIMATWLGVEAGLLALAGGTLVFSPRLLPLLRKLKPPSPKK